MPAVCTYEAIFTTIKSHDTVPGAELNLAGTMTLDSSASAPTKVTVRTPHH